MGKKANLGSIDPKPRAAFQLGFYSRHFEPTSLDEALAVLLSDIPTDVFARLHDAVIAQTDGSRRIVAALGDHALTSSHPCRVLYDLGAALADCCLQPAASPSLEPIWDCVRRLPKYLTRDVDCLHELAEEVNVEQDLEAVMKRVIEQHRKSEQVSQTPKAHDDSPSLLDLLSPEFVAILKGKPRPAVVIFAQCVSQELAVVRGARRRSSGQPAPPGGSAAPSRKVLVPTPLQEKILKALEGTAMQTKALATACDCDETKLFKRGGIKELMGDAGLVEHTGGVGYYRPDKPPSNAVILPSQ